MSGIGRDHRHASDGPGRRPTGRPVAAAGGALLLLLAGGVFAVLHGPDGTAGASWKGPSAPGGTAPATGSSSLADLRMVRGGGTTQAPAAGSTSPEPVGGKAGGPTRPGRDGDGGGTSVPTTVGSEVRIPGATSPAQRRTIGEYWTAERMRAAEPVTGPVVAGPDEALRHPAAARADELPTRDVPVQTWTGTPTRPDGLDGVQDRFRLTRPNPTTVRSGKDWTGGGAVVRTTGKVFFTQASEDYVCSGSAVNSPDRSTVITAGHCVWDPDTGKAATNWVFVPAYTDGTAPNGLFPATHLAVPEEWANDSDFDFDLSFVNVAPNGSGRYLTDAVGGQGIAFSVTRGAQTHLFGYPADPPFDGRKLVWCAGTPTDDTRGTSAQGVGCTMTPGSSGGPWFTGFNPVTGQGTITSVISFYYETVPDVLLGPYLGPQARSLFTNVGSTTAA